MFICVNNLIQTELIVEEVLFLPEPLHSKLIDSKLLKISDISSILTNLPKEDWERFWPELLEAIQDKGQVEKLKEAHEDRRIDLEKRHFRRILKF